MDFRISVTCGGKKNCAKEGKSYLIPDVQTRQQVIDALDDKFAEYFKNVTTLDTVKSKSKK